MSQSSRRKVAVITGANAGLGLNLAERLLTAYPNIRLCLACRSKERATEAATFLHKLIPDADINIVILDTSSVQSVYSAAAEIRNRFDQVDYLYLNAGTMKVKGVDWGNFWRGFFSSRVFYMFTTGEGLLIHEDGVTEDGLQTVFETNVFGHYVLIKELEDRLGSVSGSSDCTSQVIWTSSEAGREHLFSIEDFQHREGYDFNGGKWKDPYGSSKYAMDTVSVGLNNKLNKQNIYSHTICPGLVMTNMTYGILPAWFWTLILPFIWLLRIFVPSMTNTTSNGTEALFWLSQQDPSTLDPQIKYQSRTNVLGKAHVASIKMNIDPDKAEKLVTELDKLDQEVRQKYSK